MVIMIAGTMRSDVIHIHRGFGECHEVVYAVINQVALLGNVSHSMTADKRLLGTKKKYKNTKIAHLRSWDIQLLPLQILSTSHLLNCA